MSSVCTPPPLQSSNVGALTGRLRVLLRPADSAWVSVLLLAVVCGVLFFDGLNVGRFWKTESLRAIVAAEFLRSGNWTVPMLYGEPFFTKPPGMYAAIALVSWPFGAVSEWTARLPSALAATATVFLIYWYFGRQLGRRGGLIAALIVPMSPMWLEKAPSAEIDMLQVAWVTASILFFLRALEAEEECRLQIADCRWKDKKSAICNLQSAIFWLAALLCVAGGLLTKWTAPAFFYLTAVPLLWWRGRLRLLLGWKHLVSLSIAVALCLGWILAAVSMEGWEAFYSTIAREAGQRLIPSESPRPYPWLGTFLHPLKLLATALPWSLVALLTLKPSFARLWDERGRFLLQALHCWAWPSILFWSLPTEHTPRHSFPLFPALSGLAAMVVLAWMTGRLPFTMPRITPRQLLVGVLVFWMALKLVFVHGIVTHRQDKWNPSDTGAALAAAVPAGSILYVLQLKDEGVMFYYGRPVLRVDSTADLPSDGGPVYCILTVPEWEQLQGTRRAEAVQHLTDEQGVPCVLVCVTG